MYLHKEFRAAELGGDASENGDFQSEKQRLQGVQIFPGAFISYSPRGLRIVSGGAWGDNRGTMRQKMTIFKGGNSFCRDAKMYCRLMKNRGDDATENVNFQRRKQRLQECKNFKLNFDEFFYER